MNKETKHILIRQALVLAVTMALAFACSGCSMQSQIDEVNKQIDGINRNIRDLRARIAALTAEAGNLQAEIDAQELALTALRTDSGNNEAAIIDAEAELVILQAQYNAVNAELAILQSNVQVEAVLDPCNDGPGYDEVVLKTSAGYLAYFESNGNRHLALLVEGVNYTTTDNSKCAFSIQNGNLIF